MLKNSQSKVVITGIGVVTPIGTGLESFVNNLLQAKSGAAKIKNFDASGFTTTFAAEVKEFERQSTLDDRKIDFALIAADLAVEDANSQGTLLNRFYKGRSSRLSLGVGLELFSMPDMFKLIQNKAPVLASTVSKLGFLQTPSDICAYLLSYVHNLSQAPMIQVSACAASTDAIGAAYQSIKTGCVDWMLAGGTDSMINPMGMGGFCRLQALSSRNEQPKKASRPFDIDRDGFLMGEGAALLVLESLESAIMRGARVYAEIVGYGNSFDAFAISEPHPQGEGACLSMRRAMDDAGITPPQISHINAHGTSTPKNDLAETFAIQKVFGDHAKNLTVNSTKSMIGHLISASGAVEVAAMLGCAEKGFAHSTINIENQDPLCDLNYISGSKIELAHGYLLKNSFAFGGQNASLVFNPNV